MNPDYVDVCRMYYALDIIRRDIDEAILKSPADRQTREDLATAGNIIWSAMKRLNEQAKEMSK